MKLLEDKNVDNCDSKKEQYINIKHTAFLRKTFNKDVNFNKYFQEEKLFDEFFSGYSRKNVQTHKIIKELVGDSETYLLITTLRTNQLYNNIRAGKLHYINLSLQTVISKENEEKQVVIAGINPVNGCIITPAVANLHKAYVEHPITRKKFEGFLVPCLYESMCMLDEATKYVFGFLTWKLRITKEGPSIEGVNVRARIADLQDTYSYIDEGRKYTIEKFLTSKPTVKDIEFPEMPYGTKISAILDEGIEFYWKKLEHASGYEVFRAYKVGGPYKLITTITSRAIGTFVDTEFDRSKERVFYSMRSFIEKNGDVRYSAMTTPQMALPRKDLFIERANTFLYSNTTREIRAFLGWKQERNVIWESSNELIASINAEGIISAHMKGVCDIKCTSLSSGKVSYSKVEVDRSGEEPLAEITPRYYFDEKESCYKQIESKKLNHAVIMMVGDLMCGKMQMDKQYSVEKGWDFRESFKLIRKIMHKVDFSIGNLETLLAPGWPYMQDEVYIDNMNNCNVTPRYLDAVCYGGFDAVSLANNHNCDGGPKALLQTIEQVKKYKLINTGVFELKEDTRFCIININGIKIGFLSYMTQTTGFNGKDVTWTEEEKGVLLNIFSYERAKQDVEMCKKAGAEYIIVYMHWGNKNHRNISSNQEKEAIAIANAGVDFILGSNPHVLQKYDVILTDDGRSVPCYYSVGNFLGVMNQVPGNRDSVIARIELIRNEEGKVQLVQNSYIPCHTYNIVEGARWVIVPLNEDLKSNITDREKYKKRINAAIGQKVCQFEREKINTDAVRTVANRSGWSLYQSYSIMEIISREKSVSYREIVLKKLWREYKLECATDIQEYINNSIQIRIEGKPLLETEEFDDFFYTSRQKKAINSIKNCEIFLHTIFDYMKLDLPECLTKNVDDFSKRIAFRPNMVREGDLYLCIGVGDYSHPFHKPICVIGYPKYETEFKHLDVPFISCKNLASYIIDLVSLWRDSFRAKSIGISGSVGKTSTTDMIACTISQYCKTLRLTGNQNTVWQTAACSLSINDDIDVYIQEASGSMLGQLEKSARIIHPDIFVITNVGNSHIENFDNRQELLLYEKMALDRQAKENSIGIINWDDNLLKRAPFQHKVMGYSIEDRSSDYFGTNIIEEDGKLEFDVLEKDGTKTHAVLYVCGKHNVLNALCAFAIGVNLGISRKDIVNSMVNYKTEGVRQNLVWNAGKRIYLDCYNASEDSIRAALNTLKTISVPKMKRKVAILGDVLALGKESEETHRRIGLMIADLQAVDEVVFFGEAMKFAMEEAKKRGVKCQYINTHKELVNLIKYNCSDVDLLCFKGSHGMHLTHVVDDVCDTGYFVSDEENLYAKKVLLNKIRYKCIENYGAIVDKGVLDELYVSVLSEVDGLSVRIISSNAFRNAKMNAISLPNSIKTISDSAFANCRNLSDIIFSTSVAYIGKKAFDNCENLISLSVPESVHTICDEAFSNCISLEELYIPSNVRTIGSNILSNSSNCIIKCIENSEAHKYALRNGYKFVIIS